MDKLGGNFKTRKKRYFQLSSDGLLAYFECKVRRRRFVFFIFYPVLGAWLVF